MRPDEKKEIALYFGDTQIGTLSEFDEIPTIEPSEPLELSGGVAGHMEPLTLRFRAAQWESCRTRKRFIRLMGGVFGMPRNQANALARAAMEAGSPSYQDLWVDCFSYFIKQTIEYIATHDKPEATP